MITFPDVPQNHWATLPVRNMAAAGVLVGYPDGRYHGNDPVNHYQLAAVLNQYTNLADQGRLPVASRSEWNALNERVSSLENYLRQQPYNHTRQWVG